MKIVITGGTGFLGARLARRILERGEMQGPDGRLQTVEQIVLFDSHIASDFKAFDPRVSVVQGDIADARLVESLIDRDDIGVFHLASVVSAGAEQDFELAMRVNLDGHRYLLDALRRRGSTPRYVFTSSLAVYGGAVARGEVIEHTRQIPQTTYGMTKAIGELLVNEYSRKGFIDGRSARLAMVIVRPGKPNKAASGFASAVFREPLHGIDYVLPVPATTRVAVAGYESVVDDLLQLYELDGTSLGSDRAINLPNLSVTLDEMISSLQRVAAGRAIGRISVDVDPFVVGVVSGWPTSLESQRARTLGLAADTDLDSIVRTYMRDYL